MEYTYDWNTEFKMNTLGINNLSLCLEIGCFEGLTSNYIINNMLNENGKLICVDPLTDNYLNTELTEKDVVNNETIYKYFNNQYDRFINNTNHHIKNNRLELYRMISSDVFPELLNKYESKVDLIYIDGDHRASAVYIDAINSFKLCKNSGIIIFDDYSWGNTYNEEATCFGIDRFLNEYIGRYDLIKKGYQVLIRKNDTTI
jgi:predicted O-methyltransferase YrrM